MDGVDLLNQKAAAYKLDRKSSGERYYLRLLFDLMDISVVNLHISYKELNPKEMKLLDFKIVLAKSLVGTYNSRSRNTNQPCISSRSITSKFTSSSSIPQQTRGKCRYCYIGCIKNKIYIKCSACGVLLCLISGNNPRNVFANFHTEI